MAKYNWAKIKADYVEGIPREDGLYFPTFSELSDQYGVNAGHLGSRAKRENWSRARTHYRDDLEKARREAKCEALANEAAAFDVECVQAAQAGVAHVKLFFMQANETARQTREPMESALLKRLGLALDKYQKIGRLALGDSMGRKDRERHQGIDIEKAKELLGQLGFEEMDG